MIKILNKQDCCGCFACSQACPKQCITRKKDIEGFEYPDVDLNQCIDCGLCNRVCPVLNIKPKQEKVKAAYAAYAKDVSIRINSSSGGIFSLFAEDVIRKGGVVIGAAFDRQQQVNHIVIDKINDLYKLRGSKYIQSSINNTYIDTKKYLESGREVLFTGTACQISGLKTFLKKDYEKLSTADVLCHGVPTPKLWEKYIDEKNKSMLGEIREVNFRKKIFGWKKYAVEIKTDNDTCVEKFFQNAYMKLFLSNICLRPSCHNCKFKTLERDSDITLGDCWGIENVIPEMDDDKGTSVVLIHSDKGNKMFQSIEKGICFKEKSVNILLPCNADSRKSVRPNKNRDKFFSMLNTDCNIDDLLLLVKPSKFEIIKRKIKNMAKRLVSG